ncbi:DUF2515 domain-containing protein [Paenibacillus sp. Soil522]|uniref:DUF2515 domain-containing protein n=1 Tax=Paenibacillus sp. Soil522 TaxID=1736388 RepID=UPI0006F7E100|nr:DUF2515 domain-containing protein [Paenibacillus sp. Soil522]KRE39787.1 hypothetical protein ASG81_17810 [Paenibacillus sp. Soil522]
MGKKNESRTYSRSFGYWLRELLALPGAAFDYAVGKWVAMTAAHTMMAEAIPLQLSAPAVAKLMYAWSKPGAALEAGATCGWTGEELALIERIRTETAACNRNNVTRTEAYRSVYFRTSELHWALLAHMVSRNGGWNMTDLQGEWLPWLLSAEKREAVFRFLEQANALIFQDAYPQLLLYEWSRREGRSLFHLLPAFGVSTFMMPVWKQFWRDRDSVPLTIALIVNEQHYIEQRVVQHPYFREKVLHTLFFGLQSLLQLNGVIFPYGNGKEKGDGAAVLKLSGLIMERFENLQERIEFGKRLYAMLFGIPRVYEGAKCFAGAVKHTGSRADYAPHMFARVRKQPPKRVYVERLLGGRLKPGAEPLYSPELHTAWGDQPLEASDGGDWFKSAADVAPFFQKLPLPHTFEITNEYGLILSKIELAVLAMQRGK